MDARSMSTRLMSTRLAEVDLEKADQAVRLIDQLKQKLSGLDKLVRLLDTVGDAADAVSQSDAVQGLLSSVDLGQAADVAGQLAQLLADRSWQGRRA